MTRSIKPILPGATVGVLGSGQLGRMFAIAARRMGYRVHTFSPDTDTPTGQIADLEVVGAYDDLDAVRQFARGVSVVTFEFENVPAVTAAAAEQFAPVRPGGNVLHVTQHRLREKTFLSQNGFPVTPFHAVKSVEDLRDAVQELGLPSILKTAGFGYDGKGQTLLTSLAQGEEVPLVQTQWPTAAGGRKSACEASTFRAYITYRKQLQPCKRLTRSFSVRPGTRPCISLQRARRRSLGFLSASPRGRSHLWCTHGPLDYPAAPRSLESKAAM